MKICWDNLENIRLTKKGNFKDVIKNRNYHYKESCRNCGEPFLGENKTHFCCVICGSLGEFSSMYGKTGENSPLYGKKHSEEHCENISKGLKDKIRTKEHCENISKGLKGKYTGNKCHLWKGGYSSNDVPLYDTYAPQLEWCEEVRRSPTDRNILESRCTYCGKWHIPRLYDIKNRTIFINKSIGSESRLYCSDECKQECPIFNKKKWPRGFKVDTSREVQPELRQMVLERDEYQCVKCGSEGPLHCHHITGVEINPIESADIDNCVTLCKKCHKAVHKLPGCGYNDMKREKC